MLKIVLSGSFDFGFPVASLVDVHRSGVDSEWMQKRAAVMTRDIQGIKPEPGHSFLHLIDMGAQEAYGSNRNGDGFNEKAASFELPDPKPGERKVIMLGGGLEEFHPTFMKYGHVYKHHVNKDPEKRIGDIKAAAYNPDMRRGELIIKVPHGKEWDADLEKLANGKDIAFSMACKVAYDICSYCGNRAKTRATYCDHLSDHMSMITKEGHQIFAINDRPTFFDISKVCKPADRIAYSLEKVAELSGMGGAALAEEIGLAEPKLWLPTTPLSPMYRAKLAVAQKLADMEKEIELKAKGSDNKHLVEQLGSATKTDVDDDDGKKLKCCPLASVLNSLHDARISLSLKDFFKLVSDKDIPEEDLDDAEGMLPGMFGRMVEDGSADDAARDSAYDGSPSSLPPPIKSLIERMIGSHSMSSGPARVRVRMMIIRGVKPKLRQLGTKKASWNVKAAELAKEYARYQLAFAARETCNDLPSNELTVLRHYLTF